MNLLDYPYFEFRGRRSNEMNMRIRNELSFVIPEADLSFTSVDGRSSDVLFDKNRFKDIDKTFSMRLYKEKEKDIATQLRQIASWLYLNHAYSMFSFSAQPEYFYKALGYSGTRAKDETRRWLDIEFTFKCQPFVYRFSGEVERDVLIGESLNNPEPFPSYPVISLNKTTATADTNLYINGRQFRIAKEAGTGIITIDSENGIAYKAGGVNVSKHCFMANGQYEPIILEPGKNSIMYNNMDQLKIKPRWRALAV